MVLHLHNKKLCVLVRHPSLHSKRQIIIKVTILGLKGKNHCHSSIGRCSGLMVSVLVSRSSGVGSSSGREHCVGQDTLLSQYLFPP